MITKHVLPGVFVLTSFLASNRSIPSSGICETHEGTPGPTIPATSSAQIGLDDYQKATLIAQERGELRDEIIEFESAMVTVASLFFTAVAGILGVLVEKKTLKDSTRITIVFGLGQVVFFLGIIALMLLCNMGVHGAYLGALEAQLNKLAGSPIAFWETKMTPNFIFAPGSFFFVSTAFIVTVAVVSLPLLGWHCHRKKHYLGVVILSVELLLSIVFVSLCAWDLLECRNYARGFFV